MKRLTELIGSSRQLLGRVATGVAACLLTAMVFTGVAQAATPALVMDIYPGASSSAPWYLTDINGAMFFSADNGTNGTELWKSGGSLATTAMVKDVYAGNSSSWPYNFIEMNGKAYFQASDATSYKWWQSDGTLAGTTVVDAATSYTPQGGGIVVNGKLFFVGFGSSGQELYKTDGTTVSLVKDITPGGNSTSFGQAARSGNLLYVIVYAAGGDELWRSDGTEAGTVKIYTAAAGQTLGGLKEGANNAVVFYLNTGNGYQLWTSKGSTETTAVINTALAVPFSFASINEIYSQYGVYYFTVFNSANGTYSLWKSDGTTAGTIELLDSTDGKTQIGDVVSVMANQASSYVITTYFKAYNGSTYELWKTDGTAAGTLAIKTDFAGNLYTFSEYNYKAYFVTYNPVTATYQLWRSDGTVAGTVLDSDLGTQYPERLTRANGIYYYSPWDATNGFELYGVTPATIPAQPASMTVPASDADGAYTISWPGTAPALHTFEYQESTDPAFNVITVKTSNNSNSISIAGRTAGKTYYYRVRLKNSSTGNPSGWTVASNGCSVGNAAQPGVVTVPATDGDGTYTISWVASTTPGVIYQLEEATTNTFTAPAVVYTGASPNYTVTGKATDGTTYWYRVTAIAPGFTNSTVRAGANGCYVGSALIPASISVPATTATTSLTVSWGASATTSPTYVLEESTSADFSTNLRTAYTGTLLSGNVTGRLAGETYYYRVKATKAGLSDSAWQTGTNGCNVGAPAIPATITVPTSDADGVFNVSWAASTSSGTVHYVLEQATDAGFTSTTPVVLVDDTATTAQVTVNASTMATYYYRVKATKTGFVADSNWRQSTVGCNVGSPAQASSITVPASDPDGTYIVSWGLSTTEGVNYRLEEATDAAFLQDLRTAYLGTSLNATVSGRTKGVAYYYRVSTEKTGYAPSQPLAAANPCLVASPVVPVTFTVPAQDTDGIYDVTWSASVTPNITYVLEESSDNVTFTEIYRGTELVKSVDHSALADTFPTYYYRLMVIKTDFPDSAWKVAANPCKVGQITPPSNLVAPTTDPDGTYSVTWDASTVNMTGIVYVLEEVADDPDFATGTIRTAFSGTGLTASITARTKGKGYYYRVKATKTGYTSSVWVTTTVPCNVGTPLAPSSLVVPAKSADGLGVLVEWSVSTSNPDYYELEKSTTSTFTLDTTTPAYTGPDTSVSLDIDATTMQSYYFRVRAIKDGFAPSPWKTTITPCKVGIPAAPGTLTVPATDPDGTYTLSWTKSTTAGVTYVLEEALDAAFTSGLRTAFTGTANTASVSYRTSGNAYYYRVKATKAGFESSVYTEGANACQVGSPKLPTTFVIPAKSGDGLVALDWPDSVTAGVNYVVEEATSATATVWTEVYNDTISATTIDHSAELDAMPTYYYRMRVTKPGWAASANKAGSNGCKIGAPAIPLTLTVPETSLTGNYTVTWTAPVATGVTYTLQESTDPLFPATVATRIAYSGTGESVSILSRAKGKLYYYRVRSNKAGFASSDWLDAGNACYVGSAALPATFTVPAMDDDGLYSVTWTASVTDGATYVVQEATNATFDAGVTNYPVAAGSTSLAIDHSAIAGTLPVYYYRIMVKATGFADSAWKTAINKCKVGAPSVPASISVPDSDPDGNYTVTWGTSTPAGITYTLEEAKDADFLTGKRVVYTGTAVQFAITLRLKGSTYFYRVKANKTGYASSAWRTDAAGCSVGTAALPGSMAVPTTDADGSYNITWSASTTVGATYTLEEATNATFTTDLRTVTSGLSATTAAISGRTAGVIYYYRIKVSKAGFPDTGWKTGANGCKVGALTAPATLTVPANDSDDGSADGSYELTWEASPNPGVTYVLQESTNATFSAGLTIVYSGPDLAYTRTGRAAGTYYYRVKVIKTGFTDATWRPGSNGVVVP